MHKKHTFLLAFLFSLFLINPIAYASNSGSAKDSLIKMANKIASFKSFSVTLRMGYDVLQDNGEKIEFNEIRNLKIKRPSFISVSATRSDGEQVGLLYNGEVMTQFNLNEKVYAQLEKKMDLDNFIHYAVSTLKIRVPLARMLTSTFPSDLKRLCKEAYYVERDVVVADVPTAHYAGRTEDVDFQVWIADDNLPRRLIITYKKEEGQPQFWADFKKWDINPRFSREDFVFEPKKGMEKIPILIPVKNEGKRMEEKDHVK